VRTKETFAHGDLAPHGLHELLVCDEALWVLHHVAQDGERLAAEMYLLPVLPKALVVQVQSERRK
jgi:hypothetical protein